MKSIFNIFSGIISLIIILVFIGVIGFMICGEMVETAKLLDACKENGFDGIRFERVGLFQEEPVCTYFTKAEKVKMSLTSEQDKKEAETIRDVFAALGGRG